MNNDIILLFWICIFYDQARIKYYKDCYSSMLSYSDTLSWFWVNQFCDLTAPCCHTLTHYIDSDQTNSVILQLHVVILWHIILILSKPILWSYSSMLSYSDTLSWFWVNQFCVLTAPCCHTLTHYLDSEQTNSVFLFLFIASLAEKQEIPVPIL